MNYNKILLQLRTISGMDAQTANEYLSLCSMCAKNIEKRLKPDVDKNDDRLVFAAATAAYYQLCLIRSADLNGTADSITVGDVTQTRSYDAICKSAKALYEQGLAAISDLVDDGSFFFRGV
ncbi:MAG: hypothetical protein IKU25_03685 [Clostridia bacterium]|nr:hypothetical protein [Clostridia bacterium]